MKTINPTHIARLLCPALLLLSACTQNEAPDEATNTPVPLQISNVALQATADTHAASTRATTTITSGSIGVFVSKGQTGVANRKYTYTSSQWKTDTPIQIGSTPLELCAYHPYNTVASTTTTFELPAQVYSVAQDLSYATVSANTTVTAADPNALFAMKRAYALVTLQIARQQGYPSIKPCRITNVAFNPTNGGTMHSMRTLNIATGTYSDKSTAKTLSFTGLGAAETTGIKLGTTQDVNLLMPPQGFGANIRVQLTIDNVAHSFTIARTDMPTWAAGKRYQIAVSINETGVAVTQISLADWVTKEISGGTTTGKVPAPPTYFVVGSLKVAMSNLMRAGANGAWSLAPDAGYYTNERLGGDYFAWGVTDPTDDGPSGNDNESGINMDDVTAACATVLGKGWRVPTNEDFEVLIAADRVLGKYYSNKRKEMINGYYLGTSTVPADQNNYPFIPAAGYRELGMQAVGQVGYYWSSSPPEDNGAVFYLTFDDPIDFPQWAYFEVVTAYRGVGCTIRCVADATP